MILFKNSRQDKISPIIELKVKHNIKKFVKEHLRDINFDNLIVNEFLSSYSFIVDDKTYYIISLRGLYENKQCDQSYVHTQLHLSLTASNINNYNIELDNYIDSFKNYINETFNNIVAQDTNFILLQFNNIKQVSNKNQMFQYINNISRSSFYNIDKFYESDNTIFYLGFEDFINLDIKFNDIVSAEEIIKIYPNPNNSFVKNNPDKVELFLISQLESQTIPRFSIIDEPLFTFELIINQNCNFNCSYCYIKDNSIKETYIDFNYIDSNITKLNDIQNQMFNFYILGGEPTIHPMFKDLVNHLLNHKNTASINVQSNLTFNPDDYKDLNITFDISWHYSQIKDETLFLKRLLLLIKYKQLHSVNIMWEESTHDKIITLIKKLEVFKIKYTVEPQVNNVDKILLDKYYKVYDYTSSNYLNKRKSKPVYENLLGSKCSVSTKWRTLDLINGNNVSYNCTTYFINKFKPNEIVNVCEMNKNLICGDKDLYQ